MIPLQFNFDHKKGMNLLLFGAHCDDIEIGCGGSILKIIEQYKINKITWIVFASTEERKLEAILSAEDFLKNIKEKKIIVLNYRDSFLNQSAFEIKEFFELTKKENDPDLIFTHFRKDRHQDHRLISDLTWNTFRNHLILEYEIPKYDGDLGQPNFFFKINQNQANQKIKIILDRFKSQTGKHWFDEETFLSLMRIRGLESAAKYSEAFYSRKSVL